MAGYRWVRLDVDYHQNPKVLAAGRNGRDLHLASICWVARYLTDGFVPVDAVPVIATDAGLIGRARPSAVTAVVRAGLWIPTANGYTLNDFVAMNGSRKDVDRERELWRARQRRRRDDSGRFAGQDDEP